MKPSGENVRGTGTRLLRSGLGGTLLLAAAALAACTGPEPEAPPPVISAAPSVIPEAPAPQKQPVFTQVGLASWYGRDFNRRPTASGERYDMYDLTAAHRSLPLDTVVKVTNLTNNRSVLVRINDRGPFAAGRVIDLSRGAAEVLDMKEVGVAMVRLDVYPNDQFKTVAQYLDAH